MLHAQGTLVDVGAVAEACKEVVPEPVAFNTQWRAKQLEYTFLDDCLPILIRDGLQGLGLV